jgi:hypothetical protein
MFHAEQDYLIQNLLNNENDSYYLFLHLQKRMYIKIKNLEGSDEIFIKYMGLQRLCNIFDGSKVECPEFTRL